MKKKGLLFTLLTGALVLASCGSNNSNQTNTTNKNTEIIKETAEGGADVITEITTDEDTQNGVVKEDEFLITTEDGYYTNSNGKYTISKAGTYDISGSLTNGQIYVCVTEETNGSSDVILNLNGVTLTSSKDSLIYIAESSLDYDVEISAKKDTKNYIYDTRAMAETDTLGSGAIYSLCDLKLKGKGDLSVYSSYNNGIHTKDDLTIKNLNLSVTAVNNALKGNDSVSIESGTLNVISTSGDGIKTTNSGLSSKGNQKGDVTITGGDIHVFSLCDGIDAAHDVLISEESEMNLSINTSNYSAYSSEGVSSNSSTFYIKVQTNTRPGSTSSYRYSALFYNDSKEDGVFVNATAKSSGIYQLEVPSGYTNVAFYQFSSSQSENSLSTYVACTSGGTLNTSYDMVTLSSSGRPGQTSTTLNQTFGVYSTQSSSGGPGQFGPGGMNEGNSNKSEYSAKGIKSANNINVSSGTITIKSYDDGIHTNRSDILESTNTYGEGNITLSGGNITITAADDGIHADQDFYILNDASLTVLTSYEGIEGNRLFFNGGTTDVYATDDAANAATCNGSYSPLVTFTDGLTMLEVGSGDTDTLDSNGNVDMTGGILVLKNGQSGATSMTGGNIDLDGKLSVSGGTIVSIGTWCSEASLSCLVTNTQTTLAKGNYSIKDSSNNNIVSFATQNNCKGYRIYSSSLSSGTYYLFNEDTQICSFTK